MKRDFIEALKHRRSYYALSNQSPVSDEEIEKILEVAIKDIPSAFNSQTTRLVLLLREEHHKLWTIVKETLKEILPPDIFSKTEEKINNCFDSGYGTILFMEDQSIVKKLQTNFPTYSDAFPGWSLETDAMHQLAIWIMLEDVGFGASLQHYNPLIDERVKQTWNLPSDWNLIAEMPFGKPLEEPGKKEFLPLKDRMKVFGSQ